MHRMIIGLFLAFVSQPLMANWEEISPGGETRCARGDAFSFYVYKGDSKKIVVDFQGGGACWSAETCDPNAGYFTDTVDDIRTQKPLGLYNKTHADNPLKDYTHIVVPYCTGDVHWGNSDVTYKKANGETMTIHHRGGRNAAAVLNWMKDNLATEPTDLFVTGCSAGSYGSIYWTPALRQLYPKAQFNQFGDSGAGVLTSDFMKRSFPLWKVTDYAPSWIPALDPKRNDWSKLKFDDLYIHQSQYYTDIHYAQFNHRDDTIQKMFLNAMGGNVNHWQKEMLASMQNIEKSAKNFTSFVSAGANHCLIVFDDFYTAKTNGVLLKDWVSAHAKGQKPKSVLEK